MSEIETGVPRKRGDDPNWAFSNADHIVCSPQARG